MLGERVKGKIEGLSVESVFVPCKDGIGQLFGGMNIHFDIYWNASGVETMQSVMISIPYAVSGERACSLAQEFADRYPYGEPLPEEIESFSVSDPAYSFRTLSKENIEELLSIPMTDGALIYKPTVKVALRSR